MRGGNPFMVPRAPTKSAQTETQGFLALSFPLFRPIKVCIASWRGGGAVEGDRGGM